MKKDWWNTTAKQMQFNTPSANWTTPVIACQRKHLHCSEIVCHKDPGGPFQSELLKNNSESNLQHLFLHLVDKYSILTNTAVSVCVSIPEHRQAHFHRFLSQVEKLTSLMLNTRSGEYSVKYWRQPPCRPLTLSYSFKIHSRLLTFPPAVLFLYENLSPAKEITFTPSWCPQRYYLDFAEQYSGFWGPPL